MKKGVKIIVVILAIIAAFLVGRSSVRIDYREVTRFVPGETIGDNIEVPPPYRVEIPNVEDVKLPMRVDTVWRTDMVVKEIVQVVDTAQIIAEFVAINHYQFNVFDIDTVGVLDVNLSVQYNLLRSFEYQFTPMIREITRYVRPRFEPYISASVNTFNTVGVGGGFFYRNIGFEYQFLWNKEVGSSGHQILLKYRFR